MSSASIDFASALDESAELLVQDTPPESLMEGYAEKVRSDFMRGTRMTLANANLEDSKAFVEEVMANVADAEGYKASVSDINRWSSLSFEELSQQTDAAGKNLGRLSDGVAMASASAGLDVAGEVYGESLGFYSLGANALEDGSLSASEAVQLGASASSLASTMISSASAGGVTLGPIGAIAGLVIGGISFLTSRGSAQKAFWEAREAQAIAQVDREQEAVNAFLEEEQRKYEQIEAEVWKAKDTAIAEVADAWAAFEDGVGVRFGLRYFPGSSIPPRAGVYRTTYVREIDKWLKAKYRAVDIPGERRQEAIPLECAALSGCLYFPEPHPKRVAAIGYQRAFVELLEELAERDQYLTTTPANLNNERDFVPPRTQDFPAYAYYSRTFRAFDAFLVNDSTSSKKRFWVPPVQRVQTLNWKTYSDLAYEWLCGNSPACSALDLCTDTVDCSYTARQKQMGYEAMVANYKYGQQKSPQIPARALRFVASMQEQLAMANSSTDIIKTRVVGDLVQTANAVGGELATSIRLKQLMQEAGTSNLSRLSASDLRSIQALDENTVSAIDKAQRRDGLVNGGMLAAGVASLGFGAYRKWGSK